MRRTIFDLDVLRTFTTGVDLGNFAKAADKLGRSTSAVSAQLKKLEQQAGTPIFQKSGRGLALTDAGETMLAYARRLLDLNDEAASAIHGIELEGWVRLGLQEDFGETLLPNILGQFARAHPKVRIEARVARNAELIERVTSGRLDLALAWNNSAPLPNSERVMEVPMCWVGPVNPNLIWHRSDGEPLPLAALEAPCLLRTAAINALDRAGIAWRLAFISPSLGGLWAATAAGLGLTIRTPIGLPKTVQPILPGENGLPMLPKIGLDLHRADAESAPVTARLASIILHALQEFQPADAKAA
ncbi:LysR substrate-binding domain-containing protein [Phyllobacterium myrsinacearum]|uniref:DNA-binding transcriptional LysR family regulator n=1 Tax=Phyllobacterium myrsinacearum TaxID=28101 RepID=A0A839EK54_9HYPH|nr:LysR substrate-binding domain-containing protein [Phyllobacterium myrsinacearum]MBA8878708.1 DNA-binding transcriptional LysR family regulator [Phyllobacterium myrsinacearum]